MSRVVFLLVSEVSRELRHCSCFQVAHSPVGEAVLHTKLSLKVWQEKKWNHLLLPFPITVQAPGRECWFSTWCQDQYLVDSGQALTHLCEVNGSIPISHTCFPNSSCFTETLQPGIPDSGGAAFNPFLIKKQKQNTTRQLSLYAKKKKKKQKKKQKTFQLPPQGSLDSSGGL